MGMDVHGLNPKQNKNIDDFPTMKKFDSMDFSEKWKTLDKDEALRDEYWREKDKWEEDNPGIYFRNNVWWWSSRPQRFNPIGKRLMRLLTVAKTRR